LTLAFKKKYGEEVVKITQAFAEQMGTTIGNEFREKGGVTGSEMISLYILYKKKSKDKFCTASSSSSTSQSLCNILVLFSPSVTEPLQLCFCYSFFKVTSDFLFSKILSQRRNRI